VQPGMTLALVASFEEEVLEAVLKGARVAP